MIKRICIAGIAILMLTCIQFIALAVNDNLTSLLENVQISAVEEKDEVQKAINGSNVKEQLFESKQGFNNATLRSITNANELTYGTPYKVVMANEAVIDALLKGNNLEKAVAEAPYCWEVPVVLKSNPNKAVSSFLIDKIDGKWQLSVIGAFLTEENVLFSSDSDKIKTVLQKYELGKTSGLSHLRIDSVHQDYLYLIGADQEYFIPINYARKGVKAVNQEKIKQTKDEVLKQIGDDLKEMKENPYALGGGGIKEPQNNSPFMLYLILAFTAVILLGWMVMRKRA